MKIGILSDIHGNSYALKNVLRECRRENIQKLFILGDCIGYYHHPDKVFSMLDHWEYEMIKGNHESILKQYVQKDEVYRNEVRKKYGYGHDAVLEKLDSVFIECLMALPESKNIYLESLALNMSHGSPNNNEEYIYPDTSVQKLNLLDNYGSDFIFMGHTHYPFSYKGERTHIINVGSIGQSRVMGGIANWGILNIENRVFIQKHTPYDVKLLVKELLSMNGTPDYMITILSRNRYA